LDRAADCLGVVALALSYRPKCSQTTPITANTTRQIATIFM
jgi:hypothetical protein